MLAFFIGLTAGLVIGAVIMVFVARNNRNKVDNILAAADKVEDKYKNYMTKPKQ